MATVQGISDVGFLAKHIHVWPDFHGNRSPLADPNMRGMITGLSINSSEENLALLYLATLQALSVKYFTTNNCPFSIYWIMHLVPT